MPKYRLMTPGPTQVPEEALLAMARQIPHHRTPEFRQVIAEVVDGLKYVFQTKNDVLLMTASGSGGMEAALVNLAPAGGKVIVLDSGKFAERWAVIAEAFGIRAVRHQVPWGEAFRPAAVEEVLRQHSDAVAVFATLMETSTGVGHDIAGIGQVVKAAGRLLVVDAISGVGAMECRTDAWGIDVLVAGGHKALMVPPGLAILAVSPAAWRQVESIRRPVFYFDLLAYRKSMGQSDTPFTPATTLILALRENLRRMRQEGIEAIWSRSRRLSAAMQAGVKAIGLELYAQRPAEGMTAIKVPAGIDAGALTRRLHERFGVKVAGGQGVAKGRIIRIAHLGIIDELELLGALAAIELVLVEMGQSVKLGAGVGAASQVLADG